MGGKSARTKGFQFERDSVNNLKRHGIKAKRTSCSFYPDLWVNARPVSCKRRKTGLKWAYDELISNDKPHDYVLFKADRLPVLKISLWKYDT